MKKSLLFIIVVCAFNVSAQNCSHTIPPAAGGPGGGGIYHIFSDTAITDQSGSVYYVCSGVKLTMQYSAGSAYYLENNCTLSIIDHDGDVVNAKGNCTITDNSSEGIIVNKEASSTFSKPNMTAAGIVYTCSPTVFNYGQVGGNSPCNPPLEIQKLDLGSITVSPNPSNGMFNIDLGEAYQNVQFEICDLSGKAIHFQNYLVGQTFKLDFEAPAGVYLLKVRTSNHFELVKLVRE